MRKLFFLFLSISLFPVLSCDDGDVITVDLEFGEFFKACEGDKNLVLYKTKTDPTESLSLLIPNYTLEELLEIKTNIQESATLYYRTYNVVSLPNNLFCSEIPPNVNIASNHESTVTALINTIYVEDDNDGIPAELESTNGINPIGDDDNDGVLNYLDDALNDTTIGDANGMIEAGFDTDGDGLPNYIDYDDDGDNVPTSSENPDPNGDGNLSDAQDTDGDGTPDYLDEDDDGDMVKTRDEENNMVDQNPTNDTTNPDVGPDYLNRDIKIEVPATAYRVHTISHKYTVTISLNGVSFDFISQQPLDFGVLEDSTTTGSRTVTPSF